MAELPPAARTDVRAFSYKRDAENWRRAWKAATGYGASVTHGVDRSGRRSRNAGWLVYYDVPPALSPEARALVAGRPGRSLRNPADPSWWGTPLFSHPLVASGSGAPRRALQLYKQHGRAALVRADGRLTVYTTDARGRRVQRTKELTRASAAEALRALGANPPLQHEGDEPPRPVPPVKRKPRKRKPRKNPRGVPQVGGTEWRSGFRTREDAERFAAEKADALARAGFTAFRPRVSGRKGSYVVQYNDVVLSNPGGVWSGHASVRGAELVSRRVLRLEYDHVADPAGVAREHDFGPGVFMYALRDGTVLLRHREHPRRKLWANFPDKDRP